MKPAVPLLLIYLLLFGCTLQNQDAAVVSRLENTMPGLLEKGDVPGASIAYIHNGKVAWNKGFGVVSAQTNTPVTDSTVFEAASLSKPVVAYAAMKLVDEGKLDLDKPLAEYLEAPYPDVYDARIRQVTARHILSHTSGFPNWRNSDTLKIFFNPGDRFSYSGEGFVYLSKVMESITGEQFDIFIKRVVFDPLKMDHSSFSWMESYDRLKAFRHNTRGEAVSQDKMGAGYYNAASSLHTTAIDYGKFVEAVLNGEGLKKKTQQAMLTPQSQVREGGVQTVRHPEARPFQGVHWALGWGIQDLKTERSFFHWGDNGDFKAFIMAREKEKDAIVVFTNSCYGLSIVPDIVSETWNIEAPSVAWLRIERYDSPSRELFRNIVKKGAAAVLPQYLEWRKGQPSDLVADEERMNDIGLDLLRLGKVEDAIAVLKQNVSDYPQSFNVYDSLGEAYAAAGDKESAIKNYEISVRINPDNKGGLEALKKLRSK